MALAVPSEEVAAYVEAQLLDTDIADLSERVITKVIELLAQTDPPCHGSRELSSALYAFSEMIMGKKSSSGGGGIGQTAADLADFSAVSTNGGFFGRGIVKLVFLNALLFGFKPYKFLKFFKFSKLTILCASYHRIK